MRDSLTARMFFALLVVVIFMPFIIGAQTNIEEPADAMCNPVIMQCGCMQKMGKKGCEGGVNMWKCACQGPKTKGTCVAAGVCKAESFNAESGQGGGGVGMEQLMSALKGIMDALKGGGGGGGGDSGGGAGTGAQGCTSFYQTSVQGNPDPCSYYVPAGLDFQYPTTTTNLPGVTCTTFTQTSVANDPNPCSFYVPAGGTDTNGNACTAYTATSIVNDPAPCKYYVPASISGGQGAGNNGGAGGSGNSNSTNTVNVFVNAQTQGPTFFSSILNSIVGMGGGGGDIDVRESGATIYAGNADSKTNSGIAGFFGGNATNGQPSGGIITRLCVTRPWAGSLLSVLIPPTFFDTLCKLRGYQVGSAPSPAPAAPSQTAIQPTRYTPPPVTATPPGNTKTQPYVPPQADIWAVPSAVPIGARTSIFWNSKGVKSCLVSSPDGNFSETSLSGGGSTVPIVTTTVYTISCIALDDSHVTNSVTVYLKI